MAGLVEAIERAFVDIRAAFDSIGDEPEDEADDTEDPMATPVPLPENDPEIEGDTKPEDAP